jgi:hypothetical protein
MNMRDKQRQAVFCVCGVRAPVCLPYINTVMMIFKH